MLTQLTGLDAMFLYQEVDAAPMHIAGLAIYDPSTTPDKFVRFKDILKTYEDRMHLVPMFRRKLVHVPFNLDHPYWIEDSNFDLEFHVRHIALPKPGDWRQLCIQVARLHSRPLDLSRPLWEAYVIEGLDNVEGLPEGSYAVFTKLHHAAVDGASGAEITAVMHDLTPDATAPKPEKAWRPDRTPSDLELMMRAAGNNIRSPFRMAEVLSEALPALNQARATLESQKTQNATAAVPKTRFNGPLSSHKIFNGVNLPLDDVKAIRKKVDGATVNDVILSIVGGALRKYLEDKNELPVSSLIAGAPINVRTEEEKGTGGNVVSQMNVSLRTDVADPKERLQAVHEAAVESKAYMNAVGARAMTDLGQTVPAAIAALGSRVALETGLINRFNLPFNTIVTNVPGPQVPLFMGGAQLVANYGFAPLQHGLGLTHPVFSYCGTITIAFQACRDMMPDPDFYAECLTTSFKELRDTTLGKAKKQAAA